MSNKKIFFIIGLILFVCVITTISFAFFTYSRIGAKRITIRAGAVNFTFTEGQNATIINSFPVNDNVGANDTNGEYNFSVSYTGTSKAIYTVYLVANNDDDTKSYFNNNQIKYAIIKNGGFVGGTSANQGLLLSSINGFNDNEHIGEGIAVQPQEITTGVIDNYKLRIWIDKDVEYSNTVDIDGKVDGKYNGFMYSLKVKITSD